jgi:uncharacterized membrane protein
LAASHRLTAVDALRGAVMILMALDHVRDFFHVGAMSFSPEDLSQTRPLVFMTRWVTHICAPTFVFLAGMSIYLRLERDGSRSRASWYLLTRGLWLIVLELTVMRLAMNFTFDSRYPVLILILCALGGSMIAMAALIHLPVRVLALVSLAIVGLHNLADGIAVSRFGAFEPVWMLLHQQGLVMIGGIPFVVAYPILPWIGVMGLGFCAGRVFELAPGQRSRLLLTTGAGLTVAFLLLRAANLYGDPSPWAPQPSPIFTVLSFLRTTKYPPSLLFLLMTLGPALLALGWLDRRRLRPDHPLVIVGRVPLFYYVVHFWLIHVLASAAAFLRHGEASFAWLFHPMPSMGGPRDLFPAGFGYPLWVVYGVWILVVLLMYPLCRWSAGVKSRNRSWWTPFV